MDYVSLQVKTSYSILNSLNNIPSLIKLAKDYGYNSLAITDHNNMFGVMEFYLECKKNNIKPIIGLELTYNDKDILLYAKNNLGYKNLIKLSTIVSERCITKDDLIKYSDYLILVIPFLYYDKDIIAIYSDYYVGYSSLSEKELIKDKMVFINNVSYLKKEDYYYLDYLYMIKEGKVLGEYELGLKKGRHLYSKDEVSFVGNAELENIKEIVNSCNVEIGYTKDLLPVYDKNIDEFEYLSNLCNKGLKRRLNNNVSKLYQDRLDYELKIIKQMGFCNYFLVVWDYVKYAKLNNILVGPGRGSAAGSLVSYTLGITDIDPIKYDLLFERFLNPERVTMPDIDIDFDAEKRDEVINYVTRKYGEKKVAGIITFNTLSAKQVIRDVGRVLKIPLNLIDDLTKLVNQNKLIDCYKEQKFYNYVNSSDSLKKLYDICLCLEGLPRHISVHAAGIIMSRKDIDETIPLYKNQLGMFVTGYSMNYLENLGLLKMDFLGLSNLTLLSNLINEINEREHLNITFNNIPLDNKKTLEIFRNVDTDGIFQFESSGIKRVLKNMQVSSFDDIVAILALFRPGPISNIDTYIKRKFNKEKIEYLHSDLEEILSSTYGIIIYQEQIMLISNKIAGYTYGEADVLRRAMSKKKEDILLKERPKFIKRSIENGYSEDVAVKIYDLILKFANYGFNKSHSVAYAVIAYKLAFLKTYFFKYFIANLLTNSIGNEVKINNYIIEAKNKNLKVKCPNINESSDKYVVDGDSIICPLSIIKNVGTIISNNILNERKNGKFISFIDFIKRMSNYNLRSKTIMSLIYAGCFDDFNYNKKTLVQNLEDLINYVDLTKDMSLIEVQAPEIVIFDEYTNDELIDQQLSVFGFYLGNHPVNKYKKSGYLNSKGVKDYFNRFIRLILYIDNIREIITKNNDVMCFIKASDEYGMVDLTLFPNIYSKYNNIKKKDVVEIYGRVEKRFDKYQIIVNNLKIL